MTHLEILNVKEMNMIKGGGIWITLPDGSKIYIDEDDDENDDETYTW